MAFHARKKKAHEANIVAYRHPFGGGRTAVHEIDDRGRGLLHRKMKREPGLLGGGEGIGYILVTMIAQIVPSPTTVFQEHP